MTHPAYLLARLNPKNVRFDVGSGGVAELTPTDIAAALAFVPAGLGRELMCRVWWPDGATLSAKELARHMERLQLDEWTRRESKMLDALLAVATHAGGASLQRAQTMYSDAHAARWPKWVADASLGELSQGYGRVRLGILAELSAAGLCPACQGRCHVMQEDGPVVVCKHCKGSGRKAITDGWRASAVKVTEAGYRHVWRTVYEWTMAQCLDAMQESMREMEKACA